MIGRTRRTRGAAAALVTAVALPLTACVVPVDLPGRSSTSAPSTAPTTSSHSWTRAGRQLTTHEALAALPTMPDQGAKDEEEWTTEAKNALNDRSTDPAECLNVLRLGDSAAALEEHHVASVNRSWIEPTVVYMFTVRSFSQPVGPDLLDRAGAALSTCDSFLLSGIDRGEPFEERLRASPRPAPATSLGEQSLTLRMTSFDATDGRNEEVYTDHLVARVGNNLIDVKATHRVKSTGQQRLEDFATQILGHLEEST